MGVEGRSCHLMVSHNLRLLLRIMKPENVNRSRKHFICTQMLSPHGRRIENILNYINYISFFFPPELSCGCSLCLCTKPRLEGERWSSFGSSKFSFLSFAFKGVLSGTLDSGDLNSHLQFQIACTCE